MLDVRLASGHLYGKQLFTWLSLVVSLVAFFVLSFFPLDVLDEIWDLIESVSEGFLFYYFKVMLGSSLEHCSGELINVKALCQIFETSILPNHIADLINNFYNDTYCSRILCHTIVDPPPPPRPSQGQGLRHRTFMLKLYVKV